jgi:hypothetical protein
MVIPPRACSATSVPAKGIEFWEGTVSGSSWFHEDLVESRNCRRNGFENGKRADEACHEGYQRV